MASVAKSAAAGATRCAATEPQCKSEGKRAWERINDLFQRHGLHPPPIRLRDELVMHLLAHDREECAARAEYLATSATSAVPTQNSSTPSTPRRSGGAGWRGVRWRKSEDRWRKRFAVLPVCVGRECLWWGWYWAQPAPEGTYISFDDPAPNPLTPEPEE